MTSDESARRVEQFFGGVIYAWKNVIFNVGKAIGLVFLMVAFVLLILSWMVGLPFYVTLEIHQPLAELLNVGPERNKRLAAALMFIVSATVWNALATYPIMVGLDRVMMDD